MGDFFFSFFLCGGVCLNPLTVPFEALTGYSAAHPQHVPHLSRRSVYRMSLSVLPFLQGISKHLLVFQAKVQGHSLPKRCSCFEHMFLNPVLWDPQTEHTFALSQQTSTNQINKNKPNVQEHRIPGLGVLGVAKMWTVWGYLWTGLRNTQLE